MTTDTHAATSPESPETLLDLDNMDDIDMDSVEDIAGFEIPPNGNYRLQLDKAYIDKYKDKDGIERKRIMHLYSVVTTYELSDAKETAPADGTKFTERFQASEMGLGIWKRKAKEILGVDSLTGTKIGEVLKELCNGPETGQLYQMDASVVTKTIKKGDKTFQNVNVRIKKPAAEASV